MISLLALTACSPAAGQEVVTLKSDGSTEVSQAAKSAASDSGSGSDSPSGKAEAPDAEDAAAPADSVKPGPAKNYSDAAYKFALNHPDNYVVRPLPAEKLAGLKPKPLAVIQFMNPTAANSTVPDEAADFEMRVFQAEGKTLESWLAASGLSAGAASEKFTTPSISGLKVCVSTMIVPGCRFYALSNGMVYQMTAMTLEGEEMLNSVTFQ